MARNEISVVVDVKGKIDNFRAAAEQMQGYLNKLELPKMVENKSASIFSQLSREIEKIQNLTAKGKIDLIDDKNIKTAYHNIENLIGQLEDLSNSPAVRGAWSKDLIQGWNKANSAIKDYMASMKELENRQVKLQSARAGAQGRLNTASAKKQNLLETAGIRQTKYEKQIIEQSEAQGRVAAQAYQKAYETYLSQHPTSKFRKLGQDAWKNSLSKGQIAEINKTMTDKNVVNEADLAKALKLDETRVKLDGIKQIIDDIINNKRIDIGAAAEHGMTGEAKAYNLDLPNVQKIQQEINAIDDSLNKITQEAAPKFNELRQQLLQIQGIDWSKILPQGKDLNNASIEEIVQSLAKFAAAQNEAVDNSTELKKSFENVTRGAREASQPLEKAGEDLETLRERSQNAQQTLSRLQYYFSSVSVFMLFRRAIRSARDAVKELDDAMTETAVVTNYTISDLWKKLPEYTKRANELGVSTLAAYQSATLYYQQGLNDTQVSDMSIETLKMARIAGIEAADATNLMTGAIRAFNMEINKTSAQRVNDVYNKLAAMTAANTEGIATAMTKVASIAHSVGAEFENVAAFLAQMIETTQEAPETLGTALKTVLARFAEIKKLYSEGQILGTDEEGEEINVNKIQEALRSVGISMTDFLTGREGADQILLRLAEKWDSLNTVTQRYIATMGAGSRQQSRFISMLQDFGRTQELINAANNSEGAAQKQFEKTLDSLQTKTDQLRNAWNEFLLDLANSDTIKGVVDLLNNVVTAINKITGALGSGGSGIAKLLLGLGILKGGRTLLGGAKTMFDPAMLDKFGGSRTKAFRYGAASQMGFDETNYSPSNSLGGALLKRKKAQFKGFGTSFKNTFIKEEREKTRIENEGIKVRLANARKEYKEKEQLNEEAQKRLIKARENYNKVEQAQGESAVTSPEKKDLDNAEAEAASANQEYLKAQKEVTEASQPAGEKLMQYGQTMQIVGQAAGIAAGACFMLANSLEQSGNTEAAKTFKTLGTVLSVLSAVFMVVGSVAQITGAQIAAGAKTASTAIMNIPIIGWIAAVISLLVTLGVAIAHFIETDAEKAKRLQEELEKTKEEAEALKDKLSAIKDAANDIFEQQNIFDNLIVGTEAWNTSLEKLKQSIFELVATYPELADAVEFVDGKWQLNMDKYATYIQKQNDKIYKANLLTSKQTYSNDKQSLEDEIKEANSRWFDLISNVENNNRDQIRNFINDSLLEYYTASVNVYYTDAEGYSYSIPSFVHDDETQPNFTNEDYEKLIDGIIAYVSGEIPRFSKNFFTGSLEGGKEHTYFEYLERIFNRNGFLQDPSKLPILYAKRNDLNKQYASEMAVLGFDKTKASKDSEMSEVFSSVYLRNLIKLMGEIPSTDKIIEENEKYNLSIEDIKKETGLESVTAEQRESYIQSLYLIDRANELIDKQYKTYQGITSEQQRGYYLASITGENDYLPVTQMTSEELKKWLGISEDPFQDYYDQLYDGLKDSSKEILQTLASNTGQFSRLKQAYKLGNEELVDTIFSQISEEIKNLPEEAQEKARNILGTIDWRSVSDIRNGFSQLAEIEGLDIDFSNLADSTVKATGALLELAKIDFQKMLEQHQATRTAAEKFTKGERTYTTEERQSLIKGGIKSSQFIMDSTGNYTYMGDFTEGLKQIEEYSWKEWFGTIQEAQGAIEEGSKLLKEGESAFQQKKYVGNSQGGKEVEAPVPITFSDTNGESYAAQTLNELYEYVSSGKFTEVNFKGLTEGAFSALKKLGIENWDQLESQAKLATSVDENTAILTQLKTLSQGEAAGYSAQTLLSNKTTLEEEGNISVDAALDQKLLQGDLEATAEAYAKVNDYLEENGTLTKGVTLKVAEATERYDDLVKTIDDNSDALEKYDKESIKYQQAILSITKAAKRAFGDNITSDFVEENLDLFKEWASGSKEAAAQLQENLKNSIPGPELAEQDTKRFYSAIESELLNPLNFDVYGNFNKAGIDNGIQSTEEDMKKLQEYLASIGFTLTWEDLGAVPGDTSGTLRNFKASINNTAGTYSGFKPKSGGGGGKTSPWENPYDKYHNLLQEIDELLRTRNDLERQYEKILANRHSTIQDILKNSRENLANLEREIVAQKMLQKGRQEQFRNLAKDDYYFDEKGKRRSFAQQAAEFGINLSDYARYNEETQEMEINWDAFEEVERRSETDAKWAEVGKFLQKYYDKLKELTDSYEDTQDTIEEMEDAIQEILERSKEDYIDFEQELYDALVDHVQQYIDAEQKLSDTIKDAESKVLDHLRESIDLERQIRDNTKTEEDIADKENRLAYLQRDTTGANAVEIMQLQKEIQEARENYQDTLVDQELERLNRISEEAAQQREHQIELMQEQLNWAQKAGYFWDEVESILQTALKSGDTSLIEQLLKGVSDFNEKSMFGDRAWKDELIERFLKASEGRANWELDNAKENHTSWASRIAATGKEGTVGIWWDTEKKQWVDAKGNTYTGVGYDVQTGKWKYEDRSDRVKEETERPPSGGGSGTQPQSGQNEKPKQKTYSSTQKYNGYEGTATSKTSQKDADNLAMKNAINTAISSWQSRAAKILEGINELEITMRAAYSASRPSIQAQIDELKDIHSNLMAKIRLANIDLRQYKTGGLATQTGPAWLDGTPSKPEYVLNAAQTQAFLQLADVLPSMISGGSSLTNAPTAVNIDIDINVDSIANDYDVDRLCDRVKEDLYSDLMYRNINVVNLRR